MTAQCKVLHLLFSQSDYPKIECHIIQSVCLCVLLVCYHREELVAAIWNTRGSATMYMSSVVSTSWSEAYESLEWHCDEVLLCVCFCFIPGLVAAKRLSTLYGDGLLLDSMPSSTNKRWGITILNSHFLNLKAHTQCCSHCLNFSKEHETMATVLHWQNIVLIWDTHKGESDPNTRQFRISNCETDIPARYNIEQLKGCNKYLFKSI